jgi:hypothetical protein
MTMQNDSTALVQPGLQVQPQRGQRRPRTPQLTLRVAQRVLQRRREVVGSEAARP